MATVTNTVKLPDGSTPDRVDVVIELVASTTGRAAGWITATDVTLEATVRPTVTAGAWSASLTPNADITPSGSVYKVTEYVDKTRYTHYIEVGSGGGSLFDLLVDPPASLATAGSELYAAAAVAAHTGDAADAHDASAVSVLDSGGYWAGSDVESVLGEIGVFANTNAALRTGNRAIIIGDSIAAGGDSTTSAAFGVSWWSKLCAASGLRVRTLRNAGIGSNRSDQMVARFAADVTAYHPDIVFIGPTINDTPLTLDQSKTNIRTMVAAAIADRSRVIMFTAPACDDSAAKIRLNHMNQWTVGFANSVGLPLIDPHGATVDASTGGLVSGYSDDSVHPNVTGQRAIVSAVLSQLPADLAAPSFLALSNAEDTNLLANGLFLTDSNADGIANSWTKVGGISSGSLTSNTEGPGNWQQMVCPGSLGYLEQQVSSGWSVGDRLAFAGRAEVLSGPTPFGVSVSFTGGSGSPGHSWAEVVSDQTFYIEFDVPVGTTAMFVRAASNTTAGTVRVAQMTMRNLTTLGIT